MSLSIGVCVKPVPDPEYYNAITIDPVRKTIVREGIPTIINPLDKNALEAALRLREKFGGKVTIVSMAPSSATEGLRELLAMGADEAYLLCDRAFAGADTLATSYTLSLGLKKIGGFDLVFCGAESADGATSQVPSQLGEWMSMPHLCGVFFMEALEEKRYSIKTKVEGGYMLWEAWAPMVISVTRELNKPRYTTIMGVMKAKKKMVEVLGLKDLNCVEDFIGLDGSPTKPGHISTPSLNRSCIKLEGTPEEIVDHLISKLRAEGIVTESQGISLNSEGRLYGIEK